MGFPLTLDDTPWRPKFQPGWLPLRQGDRVMVDSSRFGDQPGTVTGRVGPSIVTVQLDGPECVVIREYEGKCRRIVTGIKDPLGRA